LCFLLVYGFGSVALFGCVIVLASRKINVSLHVFFLVLLNHILHPALVRRLAGISVTYRRDGLHPEMTVEADADSAVEQLSGSIYHRAYEAVAPDPEGWPGLVRKVLDLDAQPQDWPAAQVAAIEAPVMLVVADSDIVRLEHAVEMFHLLGGGVAGDIHGLPAARLAVVPGTTHTGLCDRAEWVVPMIAEFLDDAGG
jgi:pimeloyl-ACP methyl ester carboxylesterase